MMHQGAFGAFADHGACALHGDLTGSTITQGGFHHRIVLWTIVLFGCSSVFMSVMRASGAIYAPTVLGMSTILLVEIPAAYIFNNWIGIDGIWWAYALTFCIMLCMQSGYYTFIFSKRKIVKMI